MNETPVSSPYSIRAMTSVSMSTIFGGDNESQHGIDDIVLPVSGTSSCECCAYISSILRFRQHIAATFTPNGHI